MLPNPDEFPQPVLDVPQEEVGNVVQKFLDFDEVTALQINQQPDGHFTVTPTAAQD